MSEIIALDSISVANVENIFWTNGSRLKPNQLVHGTQFKIINGVRPVWINQEIVGWIILEGEYNYAIYNGVYYFLSKTTVADQGTAWIYTLTKDYWANWLSRGVRVKGDVNRTDDRKLILNYLDHVVPLVPDPCVLVRVPFDVPEEHWSNEVQVIRPDSVRITTQKSYTRQDWIRFYSQAKNAVTPSDVKSEEIKYPIIVAELYPTGEPTYKKKALEALEKLLENLEEYHFGRVTTLKNSVLTYKICLTTKGNFGVRDTSLTNRKEYYKISKLDFSGLTDIQPVKASGITLTHQLTAIPSHKPAEDVWEEMPLEKMYREVCPRYYLPAFKKVATWAKNGITKYTGELAQYVRLPIPNDPRTFLMAIPGTYGYLHESKQFRKGSRYNEPKTGILYAPAPYQGIYYCHSSVERLNESLWWNNSIALCHKVALYGTEDDLNSYSRYPSYSAESIVSRWDFNWRDHLLLRNRYLDILWNSPSRGPKAIQVSNTGMFYDRVAIPLKTTPISGSYFWTNLTGYVRETDEYDASSKFRNYGVEFPTEENVEVDLKGQLVVAYCGRGIPGFRFMLVEKETVTTTLSKVKDNASNYLAVGFPKGEILDPSKYDDADIDIKKPYSQTLTHLKPLKDEFGHDLEHHVKPNQDTWSKTVNEEKSTIQRFKDIIYMGMTFVGYWRVNVSGGEFGGLSGNILADRWKNGNWRHWDPNAQNTGPNLDLFGETHPHAWSPIEPEDIDDHFLYDLVFNSELVDFDKHTEGALYWSTTKMSVDTGKRPPRGSWWSWISPIGYSIASTDSFWLKNIGIRIPKRKKFLFIPHPLRNFTADVADVYKKGNEKYVTFDVSKYSLRSEGWFNLLKGLIDSLSKFGINNIPYNRANISDLVPFISHPLLQRNFYKAIGKGYLADLDGEKQFVYEDTASDSFKAGDIKTYDLIGTDYYLVLDRDDKAHLVFKSGQDIDSHGRESYEITKKDIPQSFVDVVSNRNILRVYNTDFDLNERIRWEDPSWRGHTPTIKIKRYAPLDKLSTLETVYVSYQGIKANIETPIQVPKEELPSVEVDLAQVDQLNLDLQKWNTSYVEKRRYKEEEIEREREKHQERRELQNIKWNEAAVNTAKLVTASVGKIGSAVSQSTNILGGAISVAGALAEIGASAAEHVYARQRLGIETEALKKDIALEVSKMALTKFNLDHEHHWKVKEYKFAMAKLGLVYTEASVNERSIIEEYVEEHHLNSPVYIKHYMPSQRQRELAEVIFKNFGCECLIDGVTLEIKDGMDPGIWGFVEVLEHYSIFEETERTLCSELLKNGVKIQPWSAEIKTPIDPQVEEQSWIEKLSSLVSMRNEETKEHLIRALFNHIEADKAFKVITELTKERPGFIRELTNSITDANLQEIIKARGGKSIFTEEQVNQKILQERGICNREKEQIRAETRREIEEAKKIAENSINIAKADASKQVADALSKKQTFEELAKSQTTKLNQEIAQRNKIQEDLNKAQSNLTRVSAELTKAKADLVKAKANLAKFHKLPLAILHLYKPIFDNIARVLSKTKGNARFGFNYGARDVSILEVEDFLFKPREERAGYGCSRKYAACIYMASYASDSGKAVQVDLRQDLIEESGKQDWLTDRSWQQMEAKFGDDAKKTKQWNTFVDTTRNFIYPKGGSLGEAPVLFEGKIVNLQEKNDKKLYWDSSEGNFIWMSGTPNAERYIPIPDKDSWNKLLTGELLGISKN